MCMCRILCASVWAAQCSNVAETVSGSGRKKKSAGV